MIGLGSYAYLWRQSSRVPTPMSLGDVLRDTAALGVGLYQICDWPPLTELSGRELRDLAALARDLGVAIELGTRGIERAHLNRFLGLAEVFDARLIRSMLRPSEPALEPADAERLLASTLPAFEAAGVVLALETYEQVATDDLVRLVERVDSPSLGICLDPGNTVARLESPREVVEACAPRTRSIHAKDYAFTRSEGWVGFTFAGAPLGTGLHDHAHLVAAVRPDARGINQIVEHWLPWQGDARSTVDAEAAWTSTALRHLRSLE